MTLNDCVFQFATGIAVGSPRASWFRGQSSVDKHESEAQRRVWCHGQGESDPTVYPHGLPLFPMF